MIIKSKRIKAKGAGLKRLLRHVQDGEDNDLVELLQGNVRDLEDARADALRFGREYSVRHWILSPEAEISSAQLAYLIALLAVEFGFDPKLAVVWKHHKPRALESACDQHFHMLVREVNAVTGGVLSNSYNFKRHEKLARQAEVTWGHRLTRGAHNRAVASALTGSETADVVAAMTAAGLLETPKPLESFAEGDHQRAKREGLDLPRLTIMLAEMLSASESQTDFTARLAAVGLRVRTGDKAGTPIIETTDNILVGSLARLTKLRKAALAERLKFNVGKQYPDETHDSRSHLPVAQTANAGYGADREAGHDDRSSGSTAPHDGSDRSPPALDGGDRANHVSLGVLGSSVERSCHEKSPGGRYSQLVFTLGCATQQGRLLDLLAIARRTAQEPLERVIGDLDDSIERNTSLANRTFIFPEPPRLRAAREMVKTSRMRLQDLEAGADVILQQLSALPRSSMWRRFWYRREVEVRKALNDKLTKQMDSVHRAAREHSSNENGLDAEIKSFNVTRAKHEVDNTRRVAAAKRELSIAAAAKTFVQQNPRFATWGSRRLYEVTAQIESIRSEPDSSVDYLPIGGVTVALPF
jgi:hypothetical protein